MGTDIGPTIGSVFLGSLFASLLYGISCAQILYYSTHYPYDRSSLKLLVSVLWILETVLSCTDVYISWLFLVHDHSNYSLLSDVPSAWIVNNTVASLNVAMVQTFYVHSVWQLQAGSPYRALVMTFSESLVLTTFASNLATTIISSSGQSITGAVEVSAVPGLIKNVSAIIADVCICTALIYTLHRRKTGIRQTDGIVQTLVVYIINRALLTLILQIVLLAAFIISAVRSTMFWAIFNSPTCKIYFVCMMAVLNARNHIVVKNSNVPTSLWIDGVQPEDHQTALQQSQC
ncbi:hypothetical protein DAEQUDRAFT_334507 [Daedalea quercina L-15889]|uniref:DUF6534 domain-containing protein n=1 Tax=Daedalea quercina L-15889 TaxID=1314783 RepID=A0A165PNA6_9APHY|nr:hypothetical protein DAEQUDRAFT_334507 [Daedalea quercina L-15889]